MVSKEIKGARGVEYISSFSRLGKRVEDLSRTASLMKAVGDPQKKLTFVHIAGTNGKGSVAQMLSCIFVESGYKTGLFTSPYILEFADRIRINDRNIPYEELDLITDQLRPLLDSHPLRREFSQFEVTQAAAFLWFLKENCDVIVLETGLGGLLDCTNIIPSPLVSVITSISLDHTAILGSTIREIAFQKGGIIKPSCPAVMSYGSPLEAQQVISSIAKKQGSLLVIPDESQVKITSADISGSDFSYKGENYRLSMGGAHQVANAAAVIEAAALISKRLPLSSKAVCEGIKKARLCGRTELLSSDPLVILDGSHNPGGTAALAAFLKDSGAPPMEVIIGMHTDKDALDAVKNLLPCAESFVAVDGFSDRDIPAPQLAELIRQAGGKATAGEDIPSAAGKILSQGKPLLICGSLYLVSYVKNNPKMQLLLFGGKPF